MSLQGALIKFIAREDQKAYFVSLSTENNLMPALPAAGTTAQGFHSLEDLIEKKRSAKQVTVERVRTIDLRCDATTENFVAAACSTPES